MLKVSVSNKGMLEQKTDWLVFFLEQDFTFSSELQEYADRYFPQLQALIERKKFTGAAGSSFTVTSSSDNTVVMLLFIGLGKKQNNKAVDIEVLRRAAGTIVRIVEKQPITSVAIQLPREELFDITQRDMVKQIVCTLNMATYHFDEFITDETRVFKHDFSVILVGSVKDTHAIQESIKQAGIIGTAVNQARHWVDLPPAHLTPIDMADHAAIIAKKHGLTLTVFNEKQVNEMGMGGLAGVSRGSDRDCRLVILEYKVEKKDAPTVCFVGKGITFDSGGLSLKPPTYMETMKEDMSGSAAVISAMDALAQLKPDINIVVLAPLAENLPSGKATKPGDIVRFYNGKTAEVKNTDAEGRLVLADALSYAVDKYKPDAMIDLATLTGACAYALGPFFTGLMSQHDEFADRVHYAAQRSGDRVWALPFHDDYKPAIKTPVADISNIGSKKYMAGAITAGFFLQNFVGDTPWVHLDIAGTAFDVPDISYYRSGGTGVGVRLLVELAMNWK